MWGLLWGCSFKFLVVQRAMSRDTEQNGPHPEPLNASAKVATVSKVAQGMETLGDDVNS